MELLTLHIVHCALQTADFKPMAASSNVRTVHKFTKSIDRLHTFCCRSNMQMMGMNYYCFESNLSRPPVVM